MSKRTRRGKRGGDRHEFNMYRANTALGWSVVEHVSSAEGERMVALGFWRRVNDPMGNHIGYQPISTAECRVDMDVRSMRASVTLTQRDMELNAGLQFDGCHSVTLGMSERVKDERAAAGHNPEDLLERLVRKIEVYRKMGAAKGDILRVWPRNAPEPLGA